MSEQADPIDRAHLTGVSRPTPPIFRYPVGSPELAELVERCWIPVWSLTQPQSQSTLQYPVCLIVVSNTYARFYGPVRGLSTVTLEGDGWAVGVMFRPAAGRLLLGRPVSEVADTFFDLEELGSVDGRAITDLIRSAMTADPLSMQAHHAAVQTLEAVLSSAIEIDEQGLLINRIVDWLTLHPEVTRVDELCEEFAMTERTLQRLVLDRVGFSPKWLIQRRRLHDAVGELKRGEISLADLAASLGYADQAHFTTDFRTVTGMTPGEYLADQPARSQLLR